MEMTGVQELRGASKSYQKEIESSLHESALTWTLMPFSYSYDQVSDYPFRLKT
jgi:hypothetical protein